MVAERNYTYGTSPRKYDYSIPQEGADAAKKLSQRSISTTEKAQLLKVVIFCGLLAICVLCVNAYIAQIEYTINEKAKQIESIQREIESLSLGIERQSTITVIEGRAMAELGMVYPAANQLIFLKGDFHSGKTLAKNE